MADGNTIVHSNTNNVDRLTSLPESILHHILSFLDMKEVVQTSLISKRWQFLWISVPNLNFCSLKWRLCKTGIGKNRKEGFMNFVDKVLFLHDDSSICKFHVFCSSYCDADRINAWMTVAVRRRVQEISITVWPDQQYILPDSISTSATVILKLKSNYVKSVDRFQLPISICLSPQLKTLELESVKFPDGDSNRKFVLSCPVLEDLSIKNCDHGKLNVLSICTPQLKNLVIEMWSYSSCKIKICTPNLTSLLVRGYLYKQYSLKNLSSLVSAKIVLLSSRAVDVAPLIQILKGLHNATNLELSGCWLMSALNPQHMFHQLAVPFMNLRRLKVIGSCSSCFICVISELLKNSSCMETLVLDASQVHEAEYCREELFETMFSCLRCVEIQNIEGLETEVKFFEFLLRNAVILERLAITVQEITWKARKGELTRFSEKINSLSKASSNLTILRVIVGGEEAVI